ncbi:Uncharacterised protein [Candidatus Bilamarchaeum dharawalense]|uniref:DUF4234 domain-containing protein n=1 Tax=Candidatus Bilamarchaeum dharawalense TaxID=2885759 RepID=A0A5E4LQK0_9ARCH|nr:Uncharacterised protein [Candidatus Bilamarchaeum dharawalense]
MMARSPIMALVMAIIPLVNLYLIYKWFVEFKDATKATYNPIIQLVLCFIPLVNLYILWKFFSGVEEEAKKKGAAGYPLGATILFIVGIFTGIGMLFMIYKTQELMNGL